MPQWVKSAIDQWVASAGMVSGPIFRQVNKAGRILKKVLPRKWSGVSSERLLRNVRFQQSLLMICGAMPHSA